MAATIEEILAAAGGTGPIERGAFTQSLLDYARAGAARDNALLAILQAALSQQARFTGPTVRLELPERDHVYHKMSSRSPREGHGRASIIMLAIECAGQPLEQALLGFIEDILRNAAGQASI